MSLKRLICFCLLLFISGFLFLSFLTFNANDPSIIFDSSLEKEFSNLFGKFGANISALLIYYFGCSAILIILIFALIGLIILEKISFKDNLERFVAIGVLLFVMPIICNIASFDIFSNIYPGGLIGYGLSNFLFSIFEIKHVYIFLLSIILAILILIDQFSVSRSLVFIFYPLKFVPYKRIVLFFNNIILICFNLITKSTILLLDYLTTNTNKIDKEVDVNKIFEDPFWTLYLKSEKSNFEVENQIFYQDEGYILPAAKLFDLPNSSFDDSKLHEEGQNKSKILEQKLERFGIKGKVFSIVYGPVITLFEYQPSIETKISNILALEDDLALALQAVSLRIIAPIPGKSVVGFELAHNKRKAVLFSEIINDLENNLFKQQLPLILGKDTNGRSIMIDLANLPHLLIAGSTGSGKSVGLNGMLMSLLCNKTPDELKLILIDPKKLEFAAYADVAHLVFPIVTEATGALIALKWAIKTMEERYVMMSQCGVKNLKEFRALEQDKANSMPYIVIIIDELADLMMISGKDVEYSIVRLAQMARASGIHLIVATQRPSVDVITGLIKVNFACRISYKVTSKIDSRTILDAQGAEKLLGQGDMLLRDINGSIIRVHGAYVTDKEIQAVVEHIKRQQNVEYQQIDQGEIQMETNEKDILYDQIKIFVNNKEEISISLIQRAFRIGYNRSARIIDQLQNDGFILPATGSKMRKVIKQ